MGRFGNLVLGRKKNFLVIQKSLLFIYMYTYMSIPVSSKDVSMICLQLPKHKAVCTALFLQKSKGGGAKAEVG